VRFSSPFLPGETLRVEMWKGKGHVQLRALAQERKAVVLSHGIADLRD
jgi:acyl dehydratase